MPPTAPMSDNRPLPNPNKVHPAAIDSLGQSPRRHRNNQLLPPTPMPIRPFARLSAACTKVLTPTQRPKIPPRRIANKDNIPAMPPIATIRTTPRNMSLPPKAHATIATGSPFNPDFRSVVHEMKRVLAGLCRYAGESGQPGLEQLGRRV
jgi:hypothetical protein